MAPPDRRVLLHQRLYGRRSHSIFLPELRIWTVSLADLLYPIRSHGCASDPDKDPVMEKDGRLPPQSNGGSVVQASKNLSNPEPNLRIFIAGATGVVGRRAVPLLVAAGYRVTAVARTPEKRAEVERMVAAVHVDLFAPDSVRSAVAGHDVVINLATSIPPSSHAFLPGAWRKNDRVRSRHARSAPAEVPPGAGANADRLVGRTDRTVAAHFQPEVAASQWVGTPISE